MLKKYLEEDPDDAFSNYALALEYVTMKEDDFAAGLFQKILDKDDQYLAAYYQFGKLLEKMSKTEAAKDIYKKGILIAKKQNNQKTFNELQSALETLNEDE